MLPPVLDVCCGSRMMWFDKDDGRGIFADTRRDIKAMDLGTPNTVGRSPAIVHPDVISDFTGMIFPDESFHLVVFDPPHLETVGETGIIAFKYGKLPTNWKTMIQKGFDECFRVLKQNGTLIFKWSEVEIPLKEILKLTDKKPLFGHRSGKKAKTHWCAFLK